MVTISGFMDGINETIYDSANLPEDELLRSKDAVFVLSCSFVILTMQSGFGLLECGCVSTKSAANIMFKNSVDVIFGSIAFWSYGWALAFGTPSNAFCSYGQFFFVPSWNKHNSRVGTQYVSLFFQSTFASTATTIVSGAISERAHMNAYVLFSSVNMLAYVIPASWVWGTNGFLFNLGFYDFAGGQVVHVNGGFMALYVAWLIGPRIGVFQGNSMPQMSSPATALSGTFILWFAWFGFNCGTTFSVSGDRWKLAALVANNTLFGSISGGFTAVLLSLIMHKRHYHIPWLINGILGGLVSVTSNCSIIEPYEGLFIGAIGGTIAISMCRLIEWLRIDDPVSAFPVHGGCGFWGSIATGIFGHNVVSDELMYEGLAYSRSFYLLGTQMLGVILIASWSIVTSAVLLWIINFKFPIRLSEADELLGADLVEHNIKQNTMTFIEGTSEVDGVRGQQDINKPMAFTSVGIMRRELINDIELSRNNLLHSNEEPENDGPCRANQYISSESGNSPANEDVNHQAELASNITPPTTVIKSTRSDLRSANEKYKREIHSAILKGKKRKMSAKRNVCEMASGHILTPDESWSSRHQQRDSISSHNPISCKTNAIYDFV